MGVIWFKLIIYGASRKSLHQGPGLVRLRRITLLNPIINNNLKWEDRPPITKILYFQPV
jgi:hypothetical protein